MKKTFLILFGLILFVYPLQAQFGNMLYTDGVQDYIVVPDDDALDLTDNFTIECWVQAKIVDNLVIYRKGWCNGGDNSYYMSVIDGKVKWHWVETGNCNYPSTYETIDAVVNEGACTHISVVHSSTEIKIYVDNVLVPGTLALGNYSTVHISDEQLDIAAYRNLSGVYSAYYWGSIDELRFWDYKLTEQEIIDYSNAPLNGDEPGLVAYFDMEDSGLGTSLTITNKATATSSFTGQAYGTATSPKFTGSCIVSTIVDEIDNNDDVELFPNPAKDFISINKAKDIQRIEIYNTSGILLKSIENINKINISDLPKAVYFVNIYFNDGSFSKEKLIKL